MLFDEAVANPNGLALDDLTRRRTWAEVVDRITRIARLLRDECGLQPDEHAAFLMSNRVECVELSLGAMLAGVWMAPINSHLQVEEIAYVVEDSGCQVLFTDADLSIPIESSEETEEMVGPLEEGEKSAILKALDQAGGNKSLAAKRLGITRQTLYNKLKAWDVGAERTDG